MRLDTATLGLATAAFSVMIASGSCAAESWEKFTEDPGKYSAYIDVESVRRIATHPEYFDFRIKTELTVIGSDVEIYQVVADCNNMKATHYRVETFDKSGNRIDLAVKYPSSEEAVMAIKRGSWNQWLQKDFCRGFWKLEKANRITPLEQVKAIAAQDPKRTAARSQAAKTSGSSINIPLRKRGGVYEVMATLNSEIKVYFIVDSGAADVTINEKVAQLLVDNGSITKADLIGSRTYQVADGKTASGVAIKIRSLNIGERVLKDVNAVVLKGDGVPVLLGQSALGRLGKWSINTSVPQLEITP